jgi:hypothetical protein
MARSSGGGVFSSANSSFGLRTSNFPLPGCRGASRFLGAVLPLLAFILLSAFQANATPRITAMTPQEGPVGTLVVITGSGFGTTQGSSTVTFNGTSVTWVSWGSSTLQVQVPAGATSGNVVVKVSGVSSNSETFTVTAPPVITSLSQTSGAVGASLTITGTGFSAGGTQTPQVVFNPQVYATPTTSSDTSVTVAVPSGATTGDVLVSVGGGVSNGVLFTVTSSDPSISNISPTGGTVGTSVTITGSNFGSSRGSSTITFNGTTGTPTSWGATSIVVPVPSGATTGNVVVTVGGVASDPYGFEVGTAAPKITSISPTSGAVGTATTITGTNFGSSQGSSTVNFNGASGIPTSWSATSIHVPVPVGTTTGNVVVNVGSTSSNAVAFTVPGTGPSITSLSPTSASVGASITVTGTNFGQFQGSSTVTFGGVAAIATGWSPTSIVATVPSGAATGSVVVTVNGSASSGVSFTVSPNIASVSPNSGIVGTSVTVTGTSFGSSPGTLTFNGTTASPTSWSLGSIVVPVPSGATTGNVVVTASGVASNGVGFSVAPNISGVSPNTGGVGSTVTVSGSGFGSSPGTVTFNGTTATPTSWSSSSITVPVPAGATTGNVVVTASSIASNGVSFTVQLAGFVATSGQMGAARYGQTATQLSNGQVLIAGGMNSAAVASSAEIYTLASQTFASTANPMNVARWLHTATLLNDGTVLIAGGSDLANEETLDSAEIYDPVAGTFTLLPSTLNTARVGHTATLLSNGQVLLVGGYDPSSGIISDSELYDPIAQVFIDLGDTNSPRFHHTATLLQNGQVLITGGETDPTPSGAYNTSEIFNPQTWVFSPLSVTMISAREGHAATLLNDGTVLITGGDLPSTGSLNTAEIYNSSSNTFTAISAAMTSPRIFHDSVLLNGGQVLLSGGENDSSGGSSTALNTAELYNPTTQTFTATTGNMTSVREHQTATLLNDGTVLEDGGTDGSHVFNTAEIYTPSKLTGLASLAISPAAPSVSLGSQLLLVATGTFNGGSTQVLSSVLWSSSSTSVTTVSGDASDNGYMTTVAQGTATITATASGISGSTNVTVPAPALVSITLTPQTLAMPLGTSQQFDAVGTYSDGSTQDLTSTATWTSSSSSATVTSTGIVTAAALGTSTIQATSGSQNSSTTVTIGAAALVSLAVSPSTGTLALGLSQQYAVIGTYTDGSTQNLTSAVTWSVVPQASASMNSGLLTAIGQGSINITAFYGGFDGVSTLTVGPPNLHSIAVSPGVTSIAIGNNQQFVATGVYTDGSSQDLTASATWTSSSNTVSTISATGLATSLANGNTTITASSGSVTGTAALSVGTATLGLNTSRYQHNATLLNNGSVLIAGGVTCPSSGSCTYLNTAELYNPNSATITSTGTMATARSAPAVLLGNGKVLVAGGYACDPSGNCASLSSAEIYDPVAATFSSAGNMTTNRSGQTMTLLNSGQVLIAGGETCSSSTSCTALNSAELYNPITGTFTATGSLNAARFNASSVALNSGQVLIVGGFNGTSYPAAGELYDPIVATFASTPSLNTPRANATATLLDDGYVLISGGTTCATGCPSSIAELYENGTFFYFSYPTSNMTVPRWNQSATLLTNGQVLLAGGYDACASSCISDSTTELFNPQGDSFVSSQALSTGRSGHTATLLPDGSVLLIGGINNGITQSSVDSYVPASMSLPQLASIAISPSNAPIPLGTTLPLMATGTDAYGDNLGPMVSVVWSSSSPNVATVSNAPGSSGIVNSQSVGTTTISATIGSVNASTLVTVTASLVSLSISPSNPTAVLNSTQEVQLTATGNYSDGSSQNLTANVTWSTSNSSVATVITTPNIPGVTAPTPVTYVAVAPVATGNANITATLGTVNASTAVTVVAPPTIVPPSITGVSPTGGLAGTQVTLTGSGFGTAQGNGIVLLGSTLGTVLTWSDTQVVATVNTGSSSGVAQIQQNNLSSNAVPFTVNTATITQINPSAGLPGTQVTITGSGFGATQANGAVWLGTAPAVVNSWSDGQVIATVATGSTTGAAQILQNGVLSNSVAFSIDSLQITSVSPTSGSAGTVVTVTGGGFGVGQGSGNVWIGNTYGVVVEWSDSQIVASVADNALSGVVKVEQNESWSNALAFSVPSSFGGGAQITLAPDVINIVVGGTQSIQALNTGGQSVTGLTWTSSNTAVATLSTDDPPTITALSPGSSTITAGSASADVTVWTGPMLPTGTVIWSNSGDGSGVIQIIPAVPSTSGQADVFALQQSGAVMALSSAGTQLWTANATADSTLVPDFQGGVIIANPDSGSWQKFDGQHTYPATPYGGESLLPHPDGTVFDGMNAIDPTTGNQKFPAPQVEQGSQWVYDGGNCGEYTPRIDQGPYSIIQPGPGIGQPIIAGDGYAYFPYVWADRTGFQNVCDDGEPSAAIHTDFHLRILRVGTDGSSMEIVTGDWASDSSSVGSSGRTSGAIPSVAGSLITNADQGVLYSWGACFQNPNTGLCNPQYNLTTIAADGTPTVVPTNLGATNSPISPYALSPVQPVLQRQDGTFVGSTGQGNMVVFDQSGNQKWAQPGYTPQIATSNNGVVAQSATGQYLPLDQLGNVTGQMPCANPIVTWTNNVYQMHGVIQVSCIPPIPAAPPNANFQKFNPSHTSVSAICGNDSLTLVLEYTTFDFAYPPFCGDFTSQSSYPQPAPDFSFAALNVDESKYNHYANWGLFTQSLLNGLETFLANYNNNNNQALCQNKATFCITSGYRSPYVALTFINSNSTPNDPHVYGKAADIPTGPNGTNGTQANWKSMQKAAKAAGACVEPYQEQGNYQYEYIHVDFGRACPTKDRNGLSW